MDLDKYCNIWSNQLMSHSPNFVVWGLLVAHYIEGLLVVDMVVVVGIVEEVGDMVVTFTGDLMVAAIIDMILNMSCSLS